MNDNDYQPLSADEWRRRDIARDRFNQECQSVWLQVVTDVAIGVVLGLILAELTFPLLLRMIRYFGGTP